LANKKEVAHELPRVSGIFPETAWRHMNCR